MSDIEEQAEQVRGKGRAISGGAHMSVKDGRVSTALEWLQPIVTGGVLAGIIYFANQVGSLKDAVIDNNKQIALVLQQNSRTIEDVRDHEVRIRSLEGRTVRGGTDTILLPSEEHRGR